MEQMHRIIHQFEHILLQLCLEEPDRRIGDIEMITPEDRKHILELDSGSFETIETCLHHLVEQSVLAHPYSLAVCSWDGDLTYCQLSELSSRLANHLVQLGVGCRG